MSTISIRLTRWLRRHSMILVATVGGAAGVAYATACQHTSPAPHAISQPLVMAEPSRDTEQDTVQIALLLDTSSSMDGLINQARAHLWKMVDDMGRMTRVVDGKVRGVKIELALYEYGNDTIPQQQGYIRQVMPFTGDLDRVSEQLNALFTNGGSEYAGQAIETAVTQLAWSSDPNALRFVFVAGNEEFDQGPVSAAEAMGFADKKDITVQLIFCGAQDATWSAAAKLAKSDLVTIDQNRVAQHIPAPQDDQILQLNDQLNDTYMGYGADGRRAIQRQKSADFSSMKMGKKVALERSQLKAKGAYKNESWDVVDAVANNDKFLDTAKDGDLPAELRGKSSEEKQQLVAAKATKRAELKAQIAKLQADREAFLKVEQAKLGTTEAPSLETEMMKTTKKVASKKGYKP